MASVSKRKWTHNGAEKEAWVVRYFDEKGSRRSKQFDLKKDADGFKRKVEREIEDGVHTPDGETVTFRAAGEAWLKDCDRRRAIGDNMTTGTLVGYESKWKAHILPYLGAKKASEVTSRMVQDFVNEMASKYSRSYTKNMLVVIDNIVSFSVARGWVKRNVITDCPVRVPGKRAERVPVPSKAEIHLILKTLSERRKYEHFNARYYRIAIVMLGIFAGMRRGEICGLLWENIDFDNGVIRVRYTLCPHVGMKQPKSKAGVRDIPMVDPVRAALLQLREVTGRQEGHIFVTNRGLPMPSRALRDHYWVPLCTAAGLVDADGKPRYTPHQMRHAAVSLLIEQGLPALHISRVIGHAQVSTTLNIYGHLFPEDQSARAAMGRAADAFSDARMTQIPIKH